MLQALLERAFATGYHFAPIGCSRCGAVRFVYLCHYRGHTGLRFFSSGIGYGRSLFRCTIPQSGRIPKQRAMIIKGFLITSLPESSLEPAYGLPLFLITQPPFDTLPQFFSFWNPLLFSVGVLRSIKDMKGNAIVFQLVPSLLLVIGASITYLAALSYLSSLALWYRNRTKCFCWHFSRMEQAGTRSQTKRT